MRLDINGAEYHIHFQYGRYDGRRQTRAEIHVGECVDRAHNSECCGAKPKGVGFAWCAYQDEFVKATGRKIALARAMQNLGLPRETRQAIWFQYLDHIGVNR
jgi:hypothetical protein